MPTIGDVRAAVLPPESEATILGTSGGWGENDSIPHSPRPLSPFPTIT